MFLKFIRHTQPCGELCRGTLYRVHFQPNEKGGYNEHLTSISDAYELPSHEFPTTLIYPLFVRCIDGRVRPMIGMGERQSVLYLINRHARKRFLADLLDAAYRREEVRIEVSETRAA